MVVLAASSLSFDGFADSDFENTFAQAREAGYRHIEFNCWYARTLSPENIARLKARCQQHGLTPIALHVGSFGGGSRDELCMNYCHKLRAILAATELGCTRVVASGAARGTEGGLQAVAEELALLLPYAQAHGVTLLLENHCQNVLANEQDYAYVFERIRSPHVGICLDTGHFDAEGVDPAAFARRFAPQVKHIHLKENRMFGQKTFCRFGEGTTDHTAVIEALLAIGYSGYMSVELSPEIGENGDLRPFTLADRAKAVSLFSGFER
jgi:sugar phosphate isomerase/epimerase